jgi:hypothetical protein
MTVVALLVALGSLVTLVLPGSSAQVPSQPDFSGEWVLVKASGSTAEQASALTVRQTITRTTMRGEPMAPWFSELGVVRRSKGDIVSSENYKIGVIGGTVSGVPAGSSAPREERTTLAVKWDGDRLIIQTGRYRGPPQQTSSYTEHEEVWSLEQKGRLLITVTDRGSNIKPTTVQLVYRRQ